jgi:CRP/FNR family transcriptional regulator, cyclic AMP receptor protein
LQTQLIGYVAAALVLATFWMKVPVRLRQVGIASNVAFIVYGIAGHLVPIAVLHAILLPINLFRLAELKKIARRIQHALETDLSMDWLRPMMRSRSLQPGDFLFRKGDEQTDIYYVAAGTLRLEEIGLTVGPGQLLGEMAVFSPSMKRTLSARCETPVDVLSMPSSDFLRLYYENPDFGVYLVRLITKRLLQDGQVLEAIIAQRAAELESLRSIAKVDEITALGDRRALEARLQAEWSRADRTPGPVSVLVVRLEEESVADAHLVEISVALSWCVTRASDFLSRDGASFVAVLPHTEASAADTIGREVREAVGALAFRPRFTVGVATALPDRSIDPLTLVERASGSARAAEADMAHSGVDHLRHASSGAEA